MPDKSGRWRAARSGAMFRAFGNMLPGHGADSPLFDIAGLAIGAASPHTIRKTP